MSRTDISEVTGTLMMILAIQIPLACYTVTYLFDLNLTHDIAKAGLCRRQSLDDEAEPEEVDSTRRFCLRYNYKVKIMLRRRMLAEQF